MRPREEFVSDLDYMNHLDHEINAARGRGDKKAEEEATTALRELAGHKGAAKRHRTAAKKESR